MSCGAALRKGTLHGGTNPSPPCSSPPVKKTGGQPPSGPQDGSARAPASKSSGPRGRRSSRGTGAGGLGSSGGGGRLRSSGGLGPLLDALAPSGHSRGRTRSPPASASRSTGRNAAAPGGSPAPGPARALLLRRPCRRVRLPLRPRALLKTRQPLGVKGRNLPVPCPAAARRRRLLRTARSAGPRRLHRRGSPGVREAAGAAAACCANAGFVESRRR